MVLQITEQHRGAANHRPVEVALAGRLISRPTLSAYRKQSACGVLALAKSAALSHFVNSELHLEFGSLQLGFQLLLQL